MGEEVVELVENNLSTHNLAVGVAQAPFPIPTGGSQPREIHVQAPVANSDTVIVGLTGVLADLSKGGWEFPPGANFILPFNAYKKLFAISASANQHLLVNYVWGAN